MRRSFLINLLIAVEVIFLYVIYKAQKEQTVLFTISQKY